MTPSESAASGYVVKRHLCDPPPVRTTGDIWRCECGKVWRSRHPGNPDFAGWYRLGPILRRLHGVR